MADNLIMNNVKYKVIPMGISTTIPAIKLFLSREKIDFFDVFFVIIVRRSLKNQLSSLSI